ncbi:MAG: hypothetical protein EOP22_09085 [Hyphomicrobiales bacterium]|nr:MAG: hypothetical protein EOP22_09085 [Hyphomicrobiales bacterium]
MTGRVAPPVARTHVVLAVVLITAFGAALRLRGLGFDSLWLDEAVTWMQTRNGVVNAVLETASDTYPPGYNIFTALAVSLLGEDEWVLRLPAAIFGALAIPAVYWLGSLSAGRHAGFIGAILVALSSFAIYYSQEARMYSLLMFAAALTTAASISYVAKPTLGRAAVIALGGVALLYSQPFGALSWLSLGGMSVIVLIAKRAGMRAILGCIAAFAAAFLLFTPWLFITLGVARDLRENGFWIPPLQGMTPFAGLAQISGSWLQFAFVILGCLVSFLFWFKRQVAPSRLLGGDKPVPRSISAPILLASAFGPWAAAIVISLTIMPLFVSRYLICCLPALLVLTAIGYAELAERGRVALAAVTALLTMWLVPAGASDSASRNGQNVRALGEDLNYQMTTGDCLIVLEPYQASSVRYYLDQSPACDLTETDPGKLGSALPEGARLFVADLSVDARYIKQLTETLGGSWNATRRFGGSTWLAIREPSP